MNKRPTPKPAPTPQPKRKIRTLPQLRSAIQNDSGPLNMDKVQKDITHFGNQKRAFKQPLKVTSDITNIKPYNAYTRKRIPSNVKVKFKST